MYPLFIIFINIAPPLKRAYEFKNLQFRIFMIKGFVIESIPPF